MRVLAIMIMLAMLGWPASACADKDDHDKKQSQKHEQKHEKKAPVVVSDKALAAIPLGSAVIWAAPATGLFVAPIVAMFLYDVYYADYPPAFKGQAWDSCANAKKFSSMEKACRGAGFLH